MQLHSFLSSVLHVSEWSVLRPGRFIHGGRSLGPSTEGLHVQQSLCGCLRRNKSLIFAGNRNKIPPNFSPYRLCYVRSWSTHAKFRIVIQLYPTGSRILSLRRPKVTNHSSPNAIMSNGGGPGIFIVRVFYFCDLSTDKCVYRLMYQPARTRTINRCSQNGNAHIKFYHHNYDVFTSIYIVLCFLQRNELENDLAVYLRVCMGRVKILQQVTDFH